MAPTVDYRDGLLRRLGESSDGGRDYLDACMEEGGVESFLVGLRDVVDARGGLSKLSRDTGLSRPALHAALSERGNPHVLSIIKILDALGMRMSVADKPPRPNKRRTA